MSSNYAWALAYLPPNINSILEVGSRDALDAISLSRHFSAPVVAFEPNPFSFAACERNIARSGSGLVSVRPEALSDSNEEIRFGVVKESDYPNPGASSMFEIDFTNRTKDDPDSGRGRIQSFITVKSARFDSLDIPAPQLLVMDCEGSELKVLKGFGSQLKNVGWVILEVNQVAIGPGACTYREIDAYLKKVGFRFLASTLANSQFSLEKKLATKSIRNRMSRPIGKPLRGYSFDVVYSLGSQDTASKGVGLTQ
jgi:FkbM family methyltransferase